MVLCRSWINVGIMCWVNTCGLFRLFCTGRKCTDLQWIVGAFQGIQVLPLGGCWFIQRQKTPHHSITIIMYTDASFKLYLQQSPFLTIFTYLLIINLKGNFKKKIIAFHSQDDKHLIIWLVTTALIHQAIHRSLFIGKGNGDTIKCWFVCTPNIFYYPMHF